MRVYKSFNLRILYLLVSLIALTLIFSPLIIHTIKTPPNTTYQFAEGYIPDYYQYLSFIQSGKSGDILLSSRYTEDYQTPTLIHTFFPLLGFVFGKLNIQSSFIYLFSRISALIFFLLVFYKLTNRVFKSTRNRITAFIIFLFYTGFYSIKNIGLSLETTDFIPWSTNFNCLGKINLPPHHLFSLGLLILAFLTITKSELGLKSLLFVGLCIVLSGFLNPSVLAIFSVISFFMLIFGIYFFLKKRTPSIFVHSLFFLSVSITTLLYHIYIFKFTFPWSQMYFLMSQFNPKVTFLDYILSLGPFLILSLFSVFNLKKINIPLFLFLLIWSLAPFGLYAFKDIVNLNSSRIFQSYQFIPLSLLSVLSLDFLFSKISKIFRVSQNYLYFIFIFVTILFSLPTIYSSINKEIKYIQPQYYTHYIPIPAMKAFEYLEKNTPKNSVVLSGEYASMMIPAFTNKFTILGREDSSINYFSKKMEAFDFLNGKFNEKDSLSYMKKHNISYVLFGIDTIPYYNLPFKSWPSFQELFRDGDVIVIKRN